jgi:enoyl-CoA hydratase
MAEVRLEREGAVAVLVLDAPERRNALTPAMAAELREGCDAIDADPGFGAAVVRGSGRTFCAGADLDTLARVGGDPAEDSRYRDLGGIYEAFLRVGRLKVPTIAAVRGAAVGAGLNLALITDLRVIAHDARLIAGFLRIGVHPGGGSLTMLHRLVGAEAAAAVALFGEELDGAQAKELGLAWRAPADEDVVADAMALAARAASDPELSRLATRSLRAEGAGRLPLDVAVEYERSAQMWSLRRREQRG